MGGFEMNNMMKYKGYWAKISYSEEDECFVGEVIGLKKSSISFEGNSVKELKKDFLDRVHNTAVVKLGEVNPINKAIVNEYNLICDFIGFDFDEVENGKEAS